MSPTISLCACDCGETGRVLLGALSLRQPIAGFPHPTERFRSPTISALNPPHPIGILDPGNYVLDTPAGASRKPAAGEFSFTWSPTLGFDGSGTVTNSGLPLDQVIPYAPISSTYPAGFGEAEADFQSRWAARFPTGLEFTLSTAGEVFIEFDYGWPEFDNGPLQLAQILLFAA